DDQDEDGDPPREPDRRSEQGDPPGRGAGGEAQREQDELHHQSPSSPRSAMARTTRPSRARSTCTTRSTAARSCLVTAVSDAPPAVRARVWSRRIASCGELAWTVVIDPR